MIKFYITFGQAHTHRLNSYTFDKDSVAVIQAKDYSDGRIKAFELFKQKWAFFHTEEDLEDGILAMEYFPRGIHPANFKEE